MINREAQGLIEAIRLQKLRAVIYLLDYIEQSATQDIAVAIEIVEDVYVKTEEGILFEQNKNYSPSSTFTLNSDEILKSLSSFLDIWVSNELSSNIKFCFLSTNAIGKESTTIRSRKLGAQFPKEKILEELASNEIDRIEKVSNTIKIILTDYYKENFPDEHHTISVIEGISMETWTGFLKQIFWQFGYPNVDEIDAELLKKIKECRFYSFYDNKGQEEIIKAKLLELVEKNSLKEDKLFRIVKNADVEVQFSAANYIKKNLPIDDVHILWEQIEKPSDARNLRDKILAVSPNFNEHRLKHLDRKAAISKLKDSNLKNSQQYLALKFRVFTFCEEKLHQITQGRKEYSGEDIERIISEINQQCTKEFEDLKKDFNYGIERNGIIIELFIEFIDSCYLSFD